MSQKRLQQICGEMRDLNNELVSLQERTSRRLEELGEDFTDVELPSEVKPIFDTLERLVGEV
jgi:hypothetical protein